jgi:hypothetical protein
MNTERLLREIDRRLAGLPEDARAETLDAVREEIGRERRRVDPGTTVETERERRLEAETLREVLEAINRQARLEDTLQEVLKQLGRTVIFDSCSVALAEPTGVFRILAARGFSDPSVVVGRTFRDEISDAMLAHPQTVTVTDVQTEERFARIEGTEPIRSWAGLPLHVEGEVIGLLSLDRHRVEPFGDEDLHRAKAVAFSAAAAIRKAQLLEQVRRYATLLECAVEVDQAVFTGKGPAVVARQVVDSALRVGRHRGGLLVIGGPEGPKVAAASRPLESLVGRSAPAELDGPSTRRLEREHAARVAQALGMEVPADEMILVPLATSDRHVGTLVLFDADGESADDRLMESFASRAAAAYLYAVRTA